MRKHVELQDEVCCISDLFLFEIAIDYSSCIPRNPHNLCVDKQRAREPLAE